jgi:hypothetical protein
MFRPFSLHPPDVRRNGRSLSSLTRPFVSNTQIRQAPSVLHSAHPPHSHVSALTLVLPGILDAPRDALRALSAETVALRRLLAHSTPVAMQGYGFWDCIAELLSLAPQQDVPLAPIWASADGIDVGTSYWLVADPVSLEAGRDDVRLVDAAPAISRADSDALYATLNAHFAADGLRFIASAAGRWFVRLATPPALLTTPPIDAVGRALRPLLATGADAAKWRRWQNEMQMLLFEHPVNLRRETQRLAAVNSIWCWAGGTLPPAPVKSELRIFTDQREVAQLGAFAQATLLPAAALDVEIDTSKASALFVAPFAVADLRAALAPAQALAQRFLERRLGALTLILTGRGRQVRLHARRPSRPQALWQRLAGQASPELDDGLSRWPATEDATR